MADQFDPPDGADGENPPPQRIPAGTEIQGTYRIIRHLNDGGMGELYLAEEIVTNALVAMKSIRQDLMADEATHNDLIAEAQRLRIMQHKGIVRYLNTVDEKAFGRLWLVMDYIEGVRLIDHVQVYGPLSAIDLRLLIDRLCDALMEAHENGVVHRDLSPDNVLLRGNKVSDAVLIDFGISKTIDPDDPNRNLERRFLGKFGYASPEQCGLQGAMVGPVSDVYSLGLLLARAAGHEALPMGENLTEAREARKTVPDLSHLPSDLQPLLRHMLQPNPQKRPDSMFLVRQYSMNPYEIPPEFGGRVAVEEIGDNAPTTIDTSEFDERLKEEAAGSGESNAGVEEAPGSQAAVNQPATGTSRDGQIADGPPTLQETGFEQAQQRLVRRRDRQRSRDYEREQEDTRGRGGFGRVIVWLIALGCLAASGFLVLRDGDPAANIAALRAWVAGENSSPQADPNLDDGGLDSEDVAEANPIERLAQRFEPVETQRNGAIAGLDLGRCRAARIETVFRQGRLARYGIDPTDGFQSVMEVLRTEFSDAPTPLDRPITADQCPVLEFVHAVQGRGARVPRVRQVRDEIRGDDLEFRFSISDIRGRPYWVVLVGPAGQFLDVSTFLRETDPNRIQFSIPFRPVTDEDGVIYLILAVAADAAMPNLGSVYEETDLEEVLNRVAEDLLRHNEPAGVGLGYLTVLP